MTTTGDLVVRRRATLGAIALVLIVSAWLAATPRERGAVLPLRETHGDEVGPNSATEAMAAADHVVVGTVVEQRSGGFRGGENPEDPNPTWYEDVVWTVAVEDTLKGSPGDAVEVTLLGWYADAPEESARSAVAVSRDGWVAIDRTGDRFLLFLKEYPDGVVTLVNLRAGVAQIEGGRVAGWTGSALRSLLGTPVDDLATSVGGSA